MLQLMNASRLSLPFAIAIFSVIASGTVRAATATLNIPKTTSAPRIDGRLLDPSWKKAASVRLSYNLRTHEAPDDDTTAYIMTDDSNVYVGFDVKQNVPVRATQRTNNVGCCVDDSVQIDLWPNGPSGFRYLFISTPIGTRYQYSSENNDYEPTWEAVGHVHTGGYTVTMKIPLTIMHGSGSGAWRVQFARVIQATNDDIVWSYGAPQQNHNDVHYAAPANGLPLLAAQRVKPRAGFYTLGSIASSGAGGSTSRAGADFSIPLFSGTSFFAAVHPDFSNVEIDQQTISPTAFSRQITEVRPFFAQGANFFNTTPYCPQCPAAQLYTPNVPTPRDGYAVEGQRGQFSYAAFDAVGSRRSDTAQVINYASPDQQDLFTVQRGTVDKPGVKDDVWQTSFTHDNLKGLAAWVRYGSDSGTNVVSGNQAQRYEAGTWLYTPTSSIGFTLRKIGAYYNPIDGYVNNPDIAGYDVTGNKDYRFASTSKIKELYLSANFDRYQGHSGGLDQSDQWIYAQITTRKLWSFAAQAGSSYLRLSNASLSPVTSGDGVNITYDSGTPTPSTIEFLTGRFGPGQLNAWTRSSTLRLGTRGFLTLELDDTDQFANATRYTQWLERVGFTYQGGPDETFALGIRRIIGTPPMLATVPIYQAGSNISATFHRKTANGELYIVYGDASAFSTAPQFLVKFIQYVGGDKGT